MAKPPTGVSPPTGPSPGLAAPLEGTAPARTPAPIEVPGIDDVARKVVDAGGALLNAKERVGDYGFSQYVKDSEGTVLCLWESIQD